MICATNLLVSLTRRWIDHRLRLPAYVLVIAAFVTAVDLVFKALWFDLYLNVGLFIPLIVTNCVILGRAEAFAARNPPLAALVDGLAHGAGFTVVLVTLGAVRETLGFGTLFAGAEMLLGPGTESLQINVTPARTGLLVATLPPGAFFALACLVAARNAWLGRRKAQAVTSPGEAALQQTP